MEKVAEKLKKRIQGIKPQAPKVPFVSTVTAQTVDNPPMAEHWKDNMKKPVLFHQAVIKSVPSKPSNILFLELGPRPVLGAHMRDLFPDKQYKTVPSVTRQSEMKTLFQSIATLYEQGADVKWKNLPCQGHRITSVPRYSFDKKHLKEKTEHELVLHSGCNMYRKSYLYVYPTEESPTIFRLLLSPLAIPSVYEHIVRGKVVAPGALYGECGFAVARYTHKHVDVSLSVEFRQLLPLRKEDVVCADILPSGHVHEPDVSHFVVQMKEKQLATIEVKQAAPLQRDLVNLDVIRIRCVEVIQKNMIYNTLSGLGFEYGTAFSLLEHAHRNPSECLATLKLNETVLAETGDTTLHPCILDCMLQATVLVLGGNGIGKKEMLPKSISGLSVRSKVESQMHVHVRMKFTGPDFFISEITLLSVDGRVLAELSDFTVQVLTSQGRNQLPGMLTEKWEKVQDMRQEIAADNTDSGHQHHERRVLVISKKKPSDMNGHDLHIEYNSNELQSLEKQVHDKLTTTAINAIVLMMSADDQDTDSGEVIQSKLINICLLIQSLFAALNGLSTSIPVYVCTFNAWPSLSQNNVRCINPSERAVWGLLRTVTDEHVYSAVVTVELHITLPTQLTYKSMQTLLDYLADKVDGQYHEVIIDDTAIYVNQVHPVNSSTTLPTRRQMSPCSLRDVTGNALVLSKKATKLSKLQAIRHKTPSRSEDGIQIRAHAFAKPHEKVFKTRVSLEHLLPERTGTTAGYVVMALEVTGQAMDGAGQELVSCCPLTVSPEVTVPTATTIVTADIPQCQAGDLSKLVLFWSLVNKVPTTRFTVLVSRSCAHLADLVKFMSCNATKRKESDVNVIFMDEMKNGVEINTTLLSLILVDVNTMTMTVKHWKNPHSLVTFSFLVSSDLQAFVACAMPELQLCLLNSQRTFQQYHLKKSVPMLRSWIKKNTGLMSLVSKCIHTPGVHETSREIYSLLQFSNIDLGSLSVKLEEDELFQKDGTYLVIGGLTGLGWICVEFLAENNAGYVAIINRSAASVEQKSNMNDLSRRYECKIESFEADITSIKSAEHLTKILSRKWSQCGRLRGIFTGAAVTQDGFFPAMDKSAFEKVLSPKVLGTWNLHQVTKHIPLDYFVMHSSVASVLGNLGQANYSVANAFMDGLVFRRHHLGLAAQTINWGPLDTGLLDSKDALKKRLKSMGFQLASRQEIRDSLRVLMLLNWPQSVPVTFDRDLYAKRIRGTRIKSMINRFQHLLSALLQESSSMDDQENIDRIRFFDHEQRVQKYEDFIRLVTTRVLSVDEERVTSDVSLYDLGLDSVTGMMLISIIERNTSFKLSAVSVLSEEVTVRSLALLLDSHASESLQQ